MKYRFSIVILLVASFSVFVGASVDDQIPNLQQPKYMIFTAGQPTAMGFDELAAMGVKTVINVLPEDECLEGEDVAVAANQMEYHQLPFDPNGLSFETLEKFAVLMNRAEKPVLIHCSTGNHVGGLWFAYRVMLNNASLPQALKEARRIGMKPAMEDAVFQWIMQQRSQQS
jgi:uncharacterized protein (TIGR01244 family)